MNTQEQTLIDELFGKLKTAEGQSGVRDAAVEAYINDHLRRQPAAPYYMAQAIVVQEAAVNQLNQQLRERDEQIRQLQAELQQARSGSAPSSGGGFLSGLFGGGASRPAPAPAPAPASSGGGWRDPGYAAPAAQPAPAPAAAPKGSGFLGGALQTAAGVAGGVMLAQGISSLFGHHSAPQEIVEVIHDSPTQGLQSDDWGGRDQGLQADDWSARDQDYSAGDGGFFDDDDSFV
ncbi:DUF2076 domain-containing protein [Pseudomonas sp. DTU_2021_1001937_2_SI_NGA_ILE_001]|uniref:DUF2076 domain-containing protein n=1 Tax=Pseudomonas sp. DTU_2021_1001937_2_SI_NGA_ILE_001 TaxID=3077589 RepID=UPI0025F887A0|nr:DUF2076 domain-containing protein [Pseudomonas sp. DTU_2021_1001937_2_SI_NGA_ILE_001]WNW13356.1 DUF2076 domain-containing protein [Pseudomonas sp. DTU_2021_1001937_2_SI_NGA_ILE_001]